jgi:hypothetical protein
MAGTSVEENIDKLTRAWLGAGRTLPLLYPSETAEILQFAERCGINQKDMLEAFRVIVERQERIALANWRTETPVA